MPDADSAHVNCGTHGRRVAAVVCCHLLGARDQVVGFIENNSDPDDLQAWCERCEAMFLAEGGLTDDFRRFNDFRVVCDFCYAAIRERHA